MAFKISVLSKEQFDVFSGLGLKHFWSTYHSMGYFAQREWQLAVKASGANGFHKSKYVGSIFVKNPNDAMWVIEAEGDFVDLVEEGHEPWDLKEGLLKSPKARRSKDGTVYTIVPFRHNVKTLKAEGIYKEIQNIGKEYNESNKSAQKISSQSYRTIGFKSEENAFGKQVKRAMYSSSPRYTGSPGTNFQGIVRTGSSGQGGYQSFRIVSSKSPSNSWIHPGYKAFNVFSSVAPRIERIVKRKLQDALMKDMAEANK